MPVLPHGRLASGLPLPAIVLPRCLHPPLPVETRRRVGALQPQSPTLCCFLPKGSNTCLLLLPGMTTDWHLMPRLYKPLTQYLLPLGSMAVPQKRIHGITKWPSCSSPGSTPRVIKAGCVRIPHSMPRAARGRRHPCVRGRGKTKCSPSAHLNTVPSGNGGRADTCCDTDGLEDTSQTDGQTPHLKQANSQTQRERWWGGGWGRERSVGAECTSGKTE